MIPAPEGFRDLCEYLHQRRIDAAWIRTVLDAYLGEYDHQQTDVDMDLDHQVWAYRQIITDFKQLIEDDVETDDDDDTGTDPAGGVGDEAADDAAERRPGKARAAGIAPGAAKPAEKKAGRSRSGSRRS